MSKVVTSPLSTGKSTLSPKKSVARIFLIILGMIGAVVAVGVVLWAAWISFAFLQVDRDKSKEITYINAQFDAKTLPTSIQLTKKECDKGDVVDGAATCAYTFTTTSSRQDIKAELTHSLGNDGYTLEDASSDATYYTLINKAQKLAVDVSALPFSDDYQEQDAKPIDSLILSIREWVP